ncbi:hypothetical protein DPM19_14510 [Actinomadura craniellae]|uniref:DUF5941 domain-containing protein n=1 Tax=Actinomadura craniellae TaxID=2231787 RepID=A0A365H664_9ACTN|nr:hypothetical protein DPM19_14510 [Actinomadura craniellae]
MDDQQVAYHTRRLQAYRDDGPICVALGRLARGQLPPLPGVLVAAVTVTVLLMSGVGEQSSPALFAPVVVLLLTGPAATHRHDGRIDWVVPPFIRAIEYGYLAVLGFAHGVSAPLVYGLIAVLAYHHYDTVYRTRQRLWPREWVFRAGLGWEGRMLLVAFAALVGALPFAYAVLAVYLGVLFGVESVTTWTRTGRGSGVMVDLEAEEEAGS